MQTATNELARLASRNAAAREELITENEQTILRTAAAVSHRYVTKSDEEWSAALCAFSHAVDVYEPSRGDFLPFAQMLIRRMLVDEYRRGAAHLAEIPVSPQILDGSAEPEEDTENVYLAVARSSQEASDQSLREEILAVNEALCEYGFRFFDLTSCSPRQEKTRRDCAKAVRRLLAEPALLKKLKRSHKLPVRELAAETKLPRKTLDRYRKYIIMAALVLSDDYPQLAEYLKFVKEGETR